MPIPRFAPVTMITPCCHAISAPRWGRASPNRASRRARMSARSSTVPTGQERDVGVGAPRQAREHLARPHLEHHPGALSLALDQPGHGVVPEHRRGELPLEAGLQLVSPMDRAAGYVGHQRGGRIAEIGVFQGGGEGGGRIGQQRRVERPTDVQWRDPPCPGFLQPFAGDTDRAHLAGDDHLGLRIVVGQHHRTMLPRHLAADLAHLVGAEPHDGRHGAGALLARRRT